MGLEQAQFLFDRSGAELEVLGNGANRGIALAGVPVGIAVVGGVDGDGDGAQTFPPVVNERVVSTEGVWPERHGRPDLGRRNVYREQGSGCANVLHVGCPFLSGATPHELSRGC
jgi:hypothetical protein